MVFLDDEEWFDNLLKYSEDFCEERSVLIGMLKDMENEEEI